MTIKLKLISILFLFTLISMLITPMDGITQTSFKGIELYSWKPTTGIWHFSLLMETNRRKTIEEITDPKATIVGIDDLKKKLSALPKGEHVYWLNYAKEPVPKKMIRILSDYCRTFGVNLHMMNI